jgi:hypothetical protein
VTVSIRRARADDVGFLAELFTHEDVEPYLAVIRPKDAESVAAEIARSEEDPEALASS